MYLIRLKTDEIGKDEDFGYVENRLSEILKIHEGKDMRFKICVHTDNYGTVSSTILAPYQENPVFKYSIGPLCRNKFRSYNQDLKSILKV